MSTSSLSLIHARNLQAYFYQELERIARDQPMPASQDAQAYVVHLLDEYTRPSTTQRAHLGFDRAAALLLYDASHGPASAQMEAYRNLGDACLYHCGFFTAQLERRQMVRKQYYQRMGQQAYALLARLMRGTRSGEVFYGIFRDLAACFDDFVAALNALSARLA